MTAETLDKARRGRRSGDLTVRTAPAQRSAYKPRPRPVILKVVSWQTTDAAARRCAAYVLGKAIEQERAGHVAELAADLGVPTMVGAERAHVDELALSIAGDLDGAAAPMSAGPALPDDEHLAHGAPVSAPQPLVELDPELFERPATVPMPAGLDADADLEMTVAGDLDGAAPVPLDALDHARAPDVLACNQMWQPVPPLISPSRRFDNLADGPAPAIDDLAAAGALDGPALSPVFPAPTPDRAALAAFQRDAELNAEMIAGIAGDLDSTRLMEVPRRPGLRFGDSIDRILELNPKGRRSCHMVVSVAGADPETLRDITQRFLAEQYPGHPYAAAMHTDTEHLHAHVILSRRNDLGQYTSIDRDKLALDRQVIASLAQEHGLHVEARGYVSPSRLLNTHFQRGLHSLAHHAERIDRAAGARMLELEQRAIDALTDSPVRAGVALTMAPSALAEIARTGPERAAGALKAAPAAAAELATDAGRTAREHLGRAAAHMGEAVRAEFVPALDAVREAVQDARDLISELQAFVAARRSGERWNRRAIEATASAAATLDQIGDPRAAAVAHVAEQAARSLGVSDPGINPARSEPGQDRQRENTHDPHHHNHPAQPHHPVSRHPGDARDRSRGGGR